MNVKEEDNNLDQNRSKLKEKDIMQIVKQQINIICQDPFNKEDLTIKDSYTTFKVKVFVRIFLYHILYFMFLVLLIAFVQAFLRSLVIAVRYATSVDSTISCLRHRVLTREEYATEWIVGGWMDVTPAQIDKEIKHCMVRNEVENVFFKFKFLNKINDDYKNRFLNYEYVSTNVYDPKKEKIMYDAFINMMKQGQELVTLRQSLRQDQIVQQRSDVNIHLSYLETPSKEDLFTYYPGRQVLRELFLNCKHMVPTVQQRYFIPLSAIHALLPLIIEACYEFSNDDEEFLYKKYRLINFWIYNGILVYVNILLFTTNIYFLQLGVQDMKRRMNAMISCEVQLEPNRYKSLMSWMDMRIMYLDMGQRFFHNRWFVACLVLCAILRVQSKINDISNNHLLRLSEIKSILERFMIEWDYSISSQKIKEVLLNNTYKEAFLYFSYKNEDVGQKCGKMIIENALHVLDSIEDRLEREIEFNPITILSIPLNMTIINAIRTSTVTLIFSMINMKLNII
ncbi:UNKNOWN [Stylonychia lemnae]|uniref:Uncharacterized protein n=1 Tax=Stylonychia lemnae TaxID=5949 RepID=A0A078A8M4_STYLE|nr:UNKNOWN [Stylonychia lemnae]|eukprot:CDW78579.1 UNKNOWN [Stylonychia lemnae]